MSSMRRACEPRARLVVCSVLQFFFGVAADAEELPRPRISHWRRNSWKVARNDPWPDSPLPPRDPAFASARHAAGDAPSFFFLYFIAERATDPSVFAGRSRANRAKKSNGAAASERRRLVALVARHLLMGYRACSGTVSICRLMRGSVG